MEPLILASSSPRRQEILKKLNIPFTVNASTAEEVIPKDLKTDEIAEYLASRKIDSVVRSFPSTQEVGFILAADTIIAYKNKIYGKPKNREEAKKFLQELQGSTHKVITGLALYNGELHDMSTRTSVNKVTMAPMTEDEIEWYLNTGEWFGVAGAYRIQGFGSCFIKKIEGTESSVMGLPIFELCDILREQNCSFMN